MLKSLKSLSRSGQDQMFLSIIVVSGLAISGSLFAEFFLAKSLCFLCLTQRCLYLLLLVMAVIGFLTLRKQFVKRICQGLLILLCLVSTYHTLVELKILKDRCKTTHRIEDISSYKSMLMESKSTRVSCSENSWEIGKIPISTMNGVLSLVLFGLLSRKNQVPT